MKVRYFIKKTKNDYSNIYLRFFDSQRIDQTAKTGLVVKFDDFSNVKQQVKPKATAKQRDFINNNLNNLKSFVIEKYNIDFNTNNVNGKWLKSSINKYFNRTDKPNTAKIYFIDWVSLFISNADKRIYKGKQIGKRTVQGYQTTLNKLTAFEKHTKRKLKFQDITLKFYNDFVSYCKTVENLNNNSTGMFIKNIKLFCKNIELENLPISNHYKHSEFVTLTNTSKDVYLNDSEINKIFEYDFSNSIRLSNARDLFIIGLRTGLRVSDFMKLKDINIKKGFVEVETTKTAKTVIIPLHKQVQSIYNKNNCLPYPISQQKFNLYIKEICKMVGINELTTGAIINKETKRKQTGTFEKYKLVSSHTCRRSFASNLYGKLPNKLIMDITGHSTETQFLKYIKITKQENAETLKEYWTKEDTKAKKQTILRKVN